MGWGKKKRGGGGPVPEYSVKALKARMWELAHSESDIASVAAGRVLMQCEGLLVQKIEVNGVVRVGTLTPAQIRSLDAAALMEAARGRLSETRLLGETEEEEAQVRLETPEGE